MPGEMSLKLNQYYGHAGNHFWKIMFELFGQSFSKEYDKRKEILLKNKIALWDVLKACVREGSSDSAILAEEVNEFDSFFKQHPHIQLIAFNGKKAETFFRNYILIKLPVSQITLPSTSSANTWLTFEQKMTEWRAIKKSAA